MSDITLEPVRILEADLGVPTRRRRLPFSPWHLVLFPLAVVMLIPLLWMLVTSFETFSETQHFPPILIPHGLQKLFGAFGGMGFAGNAALFDRIGFTPGIFWGTLVGCTELIGGILLVLGLFTRFAAAAVLIFMVVAVKFTSARGGFFWSTQGFEYPLLIAVCALFFLIRGGGCCSLDGAIGREL